MIDKMTQEEFAQKMGEIFAAKTPRGSTDTETIHINADELMCDLLRQLGYGAGVEIFDNADKWYA